MSSKKFDLGVLLYSTDYSYKGSKHFLGVGISHAERLKAVAKKPIVATIDSKDWSNKIGVNHIPLNVSLKKYVKHLSFIFKSFMKIDSTVRKNKGKKIVLIGFNFMSGMVVSSISKLRGIPCVVRYGYDWATWKEGLIDSTVAKIAQRISIKFSDMMITTTPSIKKKMVDRGKDPAQIFVVPNHVDITTFKSIRKQKVRRELGIGEKEKMVLFIGRFEKQKNIKNILKVGAEIPEIKIYLAGNGSQRDEMEGLARSLNIEDRTYFLGKVPQETLVKYINACDVFFFPTLYEGHPRALVEVMACRTPIVSSKVEGNQDVIEDGVNGLLVNPYDIYEMKEKLNKLLEDRKLANKLALRAESDSRKYEKDNIMALEKRAYSDFLERMYPRREVD